LIERLKGAQRFETARYRPDGIRLRISILRRRSSCGRASRACSLHLDGEEFEEAGATAVEEVGFTLAAGVDFLAEMQSRGVEIDRAAAALAFSFAIGANYFFQIAKFRAFRMLWARAVESFGGTIESARARIHARTSRWNETIYDPHVNILRATTEAMSAVLGGADSVTVAPFDECYKTPDEASRRLARNTQIILKREALLSQSRIRAQARTAWKSSPISLLAKGWKAMQEIEAAGGYQEGCQADGQMLRRALENRWRPRKGRRVSAPRLYRDQSICQSFREGIGSH
jgi:methylmalonyl-CoA mutase